MDELIRVIAYDIPKKESLKNIHQSLHIIKNGGDLATFETNELQEILDFVLQVEDYDIAAKISDYLNATP